MPNNPVSQPELIARLLELNQQPDQPFKVVQDGDKIVASWNIVDANWIQFFAQAGMSEQYTLTLTFHPEKSIVSTTDTIQKVTWEAGLPKFSAQASYFKGQAFKYHAGTAYGIKNDLSVGQIYQFDFSTDKIKSPIFDIIEHAGWQISKSSLPKFSVNKLMFFIAPLLIIAAVAFVWGINSLTGVSKIAQQELLLLKANQIEQFYDHTDSSFKAQNPKYSFINTVKKTALVSDWKSISFNSVQIKNDQAVLSGTVLMANQTKRPIQVEMVKEEESWKITGLNIQ